MIIYHRNATEGYTFGEEEMKQEFHAGELFRRLQEEYGKCVSKVYLDIPMGDGTFRTLNNGWVFQKKERYTDCNKVYLRETWVCDVRKEV